MVGAWTRGWPRLLFVVLLSLGVTAAPALAQDTSTKPGTISGVVVDKKNGKSLPGATVSIKGTTTGTTTDVKGRYRLTGVEAGTYKILFSFVGFQDKTITGVTVKPGETTTLDVTMAEQTAQMEEVVVEAEAARGSEAGMLKERAKAASVTDAISAETIGKSGSSSAADAVKKVTGASVTDGKYVNVRGLGGRYVNAQLNGAELPSSSPNKNAVPLDLFPAGLLDNIVTSKTFTPDKPGNFTGGNVNLQTKSFPEERTLTLSTSLTYDSEVQFDDVLQQNGKVGSVPDFRSLVDDFPTLPGDRTLPDDISGEEEVLDAATQAFNKGGMTPSLQSGNINQGYSASFGDQFEVFGDMALGLVTGAQYSRGSDASRDRVAAAAGTSSPDEVSADYRFTGESGTETESYGGIANFSLKPASNHEVAVNTLLNRSNERSAVFQSGPQPSDDDNRTFRQRRVEPIERTIWNVQGKGEHLLGGSGSPRLTWNSSYSKTTQDESDVRFFTDDVATDGSNANLSVSEYVDPTRYFRNLSEFTWSNDLALSLPFNFGSVKVGGSYLYRERDIDERRFIFEEREISYAGAPNIFFDECAGTVEPGECDEGPYQGSSSQRRGTVIQENTRTQNNVVGDRTVGAGFAMIDAGVPGVSKLRFIGGLRVEYTDQSIEAQDGNQGGFEETDLLPSGNLVYELRDDMNLRGAYGRTVARPTFREFSPSTYYDPRRQELVDGNPQLDRTIVDNFDLRWEWFPGRGELFAVSGYFKSFDAPIERVISDQALNREVDYENQKSARVFGAEFEARKRLGFLADPLRYVEVGGNLTLTESSVTAPNGEDLGRPLVGQSSYLVNADVSYDNPEMGTTVSVFYNYFDDRLDTIERQNQPNQFERGRHTIDLIASQSLMYGIDLKLSIKNVLNEEVEVYQPFEARDFTTLRYKEGRTVSIGVSYNLR